MKAAERQHQYKWLLVAGASAGAIALCPPGHAQQAAPAGQADSQPAAAQEAAAPAPADTAPAAADSKTAAAGKDGDIVVTVTHRSASLQKVPIAVAAVTESQLLQNNVRDMKDLAALSPSLKIDTPFGNTAPKITLRGVGSGSFNLNTETTVALYLDEFVLNPVSAKLGQLFDVERVEVLRGPQGTLYGKNSTGGAINYVTRRPDGSTDANFTATVARFGEYAVSGGAQTAVNEDLSVRLSFNRRYREGFQYNPFLQDKMKDRDDWGGRLGFLYKKGGTSAYLKLFADQSRTAGYTIPTYGVNEDGSSTPTGVNPITGYVPNRDVDHVSSDVVPHGNVRNRGAALNVEVPLNALTLTSVTGYLNSTNNIQQDQDGSPVNAVAVDFNSRAKQFSQEFRLASDANQKLTWIAGVTYFRQTQSLNDAFKLPLFGLPPVVLDTDEKTTSYAGFLDGTYHFTPDFSVLAGVRVTKDKKDFHHRSAFSLVGPFDTHQTKSWTEPSYRLGINYQLDPRTLVYGSYNHGYRSGAFDIGFPTTREQFKPANPEYVDSVEAGVKTTLFGRRLRLAADVFYERFKDQQLLVQRSDPGSICCSLVNAGKSEIYGLEFSGSGRIAANFNLNFHGSVMKSRYLDFRSGANDYTGKSLSNVPRYQFRIAPEYQVPYGAGAFFVSPEVQLVGSQRVSTTIDPFGRDTQPAYKLVNGQFGYRFDSGWAAFLWVRNATDKRLLLDAAQFTGFGYNQASRSEPRTFGLTVTNSF